MWFGPRLTLLALVRLAQASPSPLSLLPHDNRLDNGALHHHTGSPWTGPARGEPRVFAIGPNKAGTTTIDETFRSMGFHACHHTCADGHGDRHARWDHVSQEQNASSPLWQRYNAFSDHGDHADYKCADYAYIDCTVIGITHHSPLNTQHSPLTTHHSPLTTHRSPLTTHHSPLTTHY